MDPGRRAMIEGGGGNYGSYGKREARDPTGPRYDSGNRISKSARPSPSPAAAKASTYLTQDEQSAKFVADEDKFVLRQAKKKADIRVREGRAKPIDYLAFNLRFIDADRDVFEDDDADLDIRIPEPDTIFAALKEEQLKELDDEITSYKTLETNDRNREYWAALQQLCADRRQELKGQAPEGRAVNFVAADVDNLLRPKNFQQLEALEKQIKTKLRSNDSGDTDYWEQVLKKLFVFKAKATVKRICQTIKEARIEMLKKIDPGRAEALEQQSQSEGGTAVTSSRTTGSSATAVAKAKPFNFTDTSTAPPPGTARFAATDTGGFSQATKALYEREVARGIGEDEEIFTAEENVTGTSKPQWADKYRPRKPKHFNRVHMGYDWNKYNQTHYDHDNPPPKVVQGYKFNIFYPDLIDMTKAPTFKIIREGGRRRGESFAPAGEPDTCLIRFIAGPPYEDIAFRIVDREWDYSAKRERGFKSSFDKGILQLHFQFKKIYYRK